MNPQDALKQVVEQQPELVLMIIEALMNMNEEQLQAFVQYLQQKAGQGSQAQEEGQGPRQGGEPTPEENLFG
ncbi:MAG: hypothetical protein WC175_01105 [Candidatus Dojkabacteria bacterium]